MTGRRISSRRPPARAIENVSNRPSPNTRDSADDDATTSRKFPTPPKLYQALKLPPKEWEKMEKRKHYRWAIYQSAREGEQAANIVLDRCWSQIPIVQREAIEDKFIESLTEKLKYVVTRFLLTALDSRSLFGKLAKTTSRRDAKKGSNRKRKKKQNPKQERGTLRIMTAVNHTHPLVVQIELQILRNSSQSFSMKVQVPITTKTLSNTRTTPTW